MTKIEQVSVLRVVEVSGTPAPAFENAVLKSRRGDWAELIACAWLLENDYEVFRNVASTGPVDIVALRDGTFEKIDVKTATVMRTKAGVYRVSKVTLSRAQLSLGVRVLYVSPDGLCAWDNRLMAEVYNAGP